MCYYVISILIRGIGVLRESVYAKSLQHELLSENEEHALLYQAHDGDDNAREKLILLNLRLVRAIAMQYENTELGVEADDLIADGVFGLCKAISKYDFTFGTRLSTYATLWIHQSVARSSFLQGIVRLPEHVQSEVRAINQSKAELARDNKSISVEAISELSEIDPERVDKLLHLESDVLYVMSLDEKVSDERNALSLMETIVDEGAEDVYQEVELKVDLDFFLSKLYPEERFIVERSYGIPIEMNNREIAKVIGCHYNAITGKRREIMEMLKRLGKALRGSVSEQKQAIEDPQSVMREDKPLIDPADKSQNLRSPKQKKNRKPVKPDASKQLSFDI